MSNTVLKVLICSLCAAAVLAIFAVCVIIGSRTPPSHTGAQFLRLQGVSLCRERMN